MFIRCEFSEVNLFYKSAGSIIKNTSNKDAKELRMGSLLGQSYHHH